MKLTPTLKNMVMSADEAATLVADGARVGMSGFTRAGDAKALPEALARRAEAEPFSISLGTGASLGYGADGVLADAGVLERRYPFQADPQLRGAINRGDVLYLDQHLSETAEAIRAGHLPAPNVAIVEALAVTEEGVTPTTSVGNTPLFLDRAETVIIELNRAQPDALIGVHDIYDPGPWGSRAPIGVHAPADRIGKTAIPLDLSKVKAVVVTDRPDAPAPVAGAEGETGQIAGLLLEFLASEIAKGRLDESLAPVQAGIGAVANAVLGGFADGPFDNLTMYSEVLQDSTFDLFDSGRLRCASGSSITLGSRRDALENFERYRDRVVLRPQEISNHPEIIRRLGVIAINTALEADIYGAVNSTHVNGSMMFNGVGGSGDFARNARLSVFVCRAAAKGGALSAIVPMASHVDHPTQDVDVLVTEFGLADLRGRAPRERAPLIIENCVHPRFRDMARDYYRRAVRRGGHTPHLLDEAFAWHERAARLGDMAPEQEALCA
ncbi:succinate CoA transferase [Phenylobacterium sp.]|uniref:succinate CoA transferase n=1 Tax=Phenylobacterium sp. TaxID=1871053 RepID=UPI0035AE090E